MPIILDLPDEAATEALAARLAALARPRDVLALAGPLGSGKTTLARAFIRTLAGADEEVPSPTFTLVQTYATARGTVWHFDLFRLERPEDALELGMEEAFADGISLIEWPERLGPWLPAARLDIALAPGARVTARQARIEGDPSWHGRLQAVADD